MSMSMRRSASPSRTSVLRQNSQTPWKDAADLKTTGAPQEGQEAVSATGCWSGQLLEQLGLLAGKFFIGQDAFGLQVGQLLQRGHDFVGPHAHRGRCSGGRLCRAALQAELLRRFSRDDPPAFHLSQRQRQWKKSQLQ